MADLNTNLPAFPTLGSATPGSPGGLTTMFSQMLSSVLGVKNPSNPANPSYDEDSENFLSTDQGGKSSNPKAQPKTPANSTAIKTKTALPDIGNNDVTRGIYAQNQLISPNAINSAEMNKKASQGLNNILSALSGDGTDLGSIGKAAGAASSVADSVSSGIAAVLAFL